MAKEAYMYYSQFCHELLCRYLCRSCAIKNVNENALSLFFNGLLEFVGICEPGTSLLLVPNWARFSKVGFSRSGNPGKRRKRPAHS